MKKSLAVMLALIMVLCMIPTTAFAEAGDWDPLTDPNTVAGSLVGNETFSASTTMEAGKDGYLRLMPTLDTGNSTYNAMAYCGATATSNNTSIAEVKSIEIGKWVGGVWNNADCLQVTVNPKAAGTTTVVINFYYTFSQSPNPLTNPNAKWFYGTSYYTINVTEPTKPNPPTPENTSKPVAGLTGEEAVQVHCTNSTANHADESYGLKPNSYTVSNVEGDATNGYTCTITVQSEKYVNDYNAGINVNHTLDGSPTGTIKLEWDGSKWKVVSGVPVVFNVKCETTQPPTDNPPAKPEPENTSKPFIELTGEKAVKVHCTNDKANHDDKSYGLMHDGYTVGEVQGDKENGYTCEITVEPAKYVAQYNSEINVEHKLDPESQPGKIKLEWDGSKWKVDSGVPVVFDVKCETQEPSTDTPKLPAADVIPKIVGKDAVKVLCTTNAKHAAMRCDLLENSFDIGVVTKEETSGEYFCNITVHADKYVKKYNEYLKGHTLKTEGQTGTITLNWDAAGKQWKYTENKLPVTFTVMCETVPEETYYIVTYTDGVGGTAFVDQAIRVKSGDPTPAFNGTPSRSGYTFTGWTPAVTDTVTDNVTYTAQWKNNDNHTPGGGNGGGHSHYHPTTTPVPVIVIPPKTGDMTIWQSILHFLGIR